MAMPHEPLYRGEAGITLQSRLEPPAVQLNMNYNNLLFDVGSGTSTKRILNGISGSLRPGELTAIMGPSGAGKTTFMNVLAGRAPYGCASGTISLNGEAVDPVQYRKSLAYVMQQDALFATQTPRECLHFTAALKLPDLSPAEREELVESVITALGLTKCADTLIGSVMIPGLSGGEKKRTAVAVELISSPSLIFLDEPTSGLDSHSAFELVKILRALAEAGRTIVCTIHQPSSEVFDMFHKVMLLRSGSMVYNGPVSGITEHFATIGVHCKPNYNPADFAMHQLQILSDEEVEPLVAKVEPEKQGSQISGVASGAASEPHRAGFLTQLLLLAKREGQQFIRNKQTLGARYGAATVLSLLTGLIFFNKGSDWGSDNDPADIVTKINNHWGALVFLCINTMFLASQPMLLVFPVERPVFIREYIAGSYGAVPYLLGKTAIELPAAALQVLLALTIVYNMVDLRGYFILLVLSLALLAAVSASTALLLGAATTRVETAMNLLPILYIPQILFAGFLISSDSIPTFIRWLQWVCPLKYAVSLGTVLEFAAHAVPDDREAAALSLIDRLEADRSDWRIYVAVLAGLCVGFRILAGLLLAYRAQTFS